ncbi:alpha-amylase [Alsobacter soli]|uniref:Alpha-amylase n=2 Tax=Alsobacter soli TaxID=2109933 RepID=A0A2T1HRB8_9HYPH|nr:alpha-amylase [Alsobacter soli]
MSGGGQPWWRRAVFYELYLRSFQDSDGDGIGDLPGVLRRVDYLAELGVDAVWVTPFYPSPMADFGYDVADHCGVDPTYGALADVDRLLEALDRRGMRLVLDYVPNHTSVEHPWFREARASRSAERRDWYLWREPAPDGGPPNNWLSQAGGSAWTFDERTGQYYLHSFLPEQPDLNWRNPAVREAMLQVLRFWLDRGVHGFRVDVLGALLKDADFRDDPPNPRYQPGDPDFMRLLPIRSANQPEILEIVAAMRAVLARYPGERVLIGELYDPVETLVSYYGPALGGVQLPFNMNLLWLRWCAQGVLDLVNRYEAGLPGGAWPTWVLGNHDQPRVASRLGPGQARVAAMLLLTLRGAPTLYQGDELGLRNAEIPPHRVRDRFTGPGRCRDQQRSPMLWDDGPGAGFTAGEPWLPVEPRAGASVRAQQEDPGSMLSLTRALLALRRREAALVDGDWRGISAADNVLIYERCNAERRIRVALNMDETPKEGGFAGEGAWRVALSTDPARDKGWIDGVFTLAGDEGVVLRPENRTGGGPR